MDFIVGVCPPFSVLHGQVSYNRDRIFEEGYLFNTTATVTCNAGAVTLASGELLTSYTYIYVVLFLFGVNL